MQTGHAAFEAASLNPPDTEHPHFAVVGVADERALLAAADRVRKLGFKIALWHEPDLGDSLTAFAVEPVSGQQRTHFRKYQLLKGEEPVAQPSFWGRVRSRFWGAAR